MSGERHLKSGTEEWFRSAPMEYISIVMQEHCAQRCIFQLGRLGSVQFTDLNGEQTAFQRRFVHEVQKCDEMERKIRFFEEMLEKYGIEARAAPQIEDFLDKMETRDSMVLDELSVLLEEKESELRELNNYRARMRADYNAQIELRCVLERAQTFMEGGQGAERHARAAPAGELELEDGNVAGRDVAPAPRRTTGGDGTLRFSFIAGVISEADKSRFERMVFRSTRGNCLMRFSPIEELIEDPATGVEVLKEVFIIFYQAPYVEAKIKRICEAFSANIYQIPDLDNTTAMDAMIRDTNSDINEREMVLTRNLADITQLLKHVAKHVYVWQHATKCLKLVYHTLNCLRHDIAGILRAEAWIPIEVRDEVTRIVQDVHSHGGSHSLPSSVTGLPPDQWPSAPPTYFHTNKVTKFFQDIVDTYGVPRYQEANPAVFTVITFPFMFGLMFGDIGHGLLLTIFAVWLVRNEEMLAQMKGNEVIEGLHPGRYMLLLMGFFATYCGLLYNDFFAIGLRLFEPQWIEVFPDEPTDNLVFKPKNGVYPLGVDPTWHHAENGLLFFNSLKMKMSVVFGVTQMAGGLILKAMNAIYWKSDLDLYYVAIPQIVFLLSLFGYLCCLILIKWSLRWNENCCNDPEPGFESLSQPCNETARNCDPPSLITTLINIVLSIGTVEEDERLYDGQATVQTILLLVAVAMIPLMFFPKPMIVIRRMKKAHYDEHSEAGEALVNESENEQVHHGDDDDDEEHSPMDIWIHQAIETIEFVLGSVSNTASYLRLWALSLAHSQLAAVFLEKTLIELIREEDGFLGGIMAFVGYGAFAGITFAVLMLMDQLECFLHALRLHWVEFQNKFFHGDGLEFTPLDLKKIQDD